MARWQDETCGTCKFRADNGPCRESPPGLIVLPGAPVKAIVSPQQQQGMNLTILSAYPPVPANHPACSRWIKGIDKTSKIANVAPGVKPGVN